MIKVAPLRYGVIFKKAFCVPEIFNAFVRDVIGVHIKVDEVETEKSFAPTVGAVGIQYDLYAEDLKNRVVVAIRHEPHTDHYERFLYYACFPIAQHIAPALKPLPKLTVYTVFVLTSGDKHKKDIVITDLDPKDRDGNGIGEISHKIIHIAPKYMDEKTPKAMREWLRAINDSFDEEVNEDAYERPEIHKIFELIKEDDVTPSERFQMINEYNYGEKVAESFNKGVQKGLAERREERKTEAMISVAQNLLSLDLPVEQIIETTGLSAEQIHVLSA